MVHIIFKNLERSKLAREAVLKRIELFTNKFPDLKESRIQVALEMQNSPRHPGPDLFSVAFHVLDGRYRGLQLKKSASSLYEALARLADHILEALNRRGDRDRVKERAKARRFLAAASSMDRMSRASKSD